MAKYHTGFNRFWEDDEKPKKKDPAADDDLMKRAMEAADRLSKQERESAKYYKDLPAKYKSRGSKNSQYGQITGRV